MDIMLDLDRLREAQRGLRTSIDEFENASKTNDDLEKAVDRPDDRGELRDIAHDFEGAWNDKRDALQDNLKGIEDTLTSIIDNWTEWDTQTAADLSSGGTETQSAVR